MKGGMGNLMKQAQQMPNHPCKDMNLESKIHYLNGLVLVANEDDSISTNEKKYLSMLIDSFGLDKDMIEDFIIFAKNPEMSKAQEESQNRMNSVTGGIMGGMKIPGM